MEEKKHGRVDGNTAVRRGAQTQEEGITKGNHRKEVKR